MLLGFNASGLSFFYCIELELCKVKAKDNNNIQAAKNNAHIFQSGTNGFKLVGGDELMAEGKMYDIVAKNTVNGVTIYYAVSDKEEDSILTKLSAPVKAGAADKSLASKRIKVSDLNYSLLKANKYPSPTFSKIKAFGALDKPDFYQAWFGVIFSPPPENCHS